MRLFTGIELPTEVAEPLERLLTHLRPTAHLRWSPVYNLHITTKFIGEWPQERMDELATALEALPKRPPFEISIGGLGWFPNPHSPRVFWAGVHGGGPLNDLALAIDNALEPLGVARETRPYSPHLTLARANLGIPLQPIRQAIAQLNSVEFGSFQPDAFHLYLSQTGAAGAVYSKLRTFRLPA